MFYQVRSTQLGDGDCDLECNIQPCNFDSIYGQDGDCIKFCFESECRREQLGNGVCDLECKGLACGFDLGDCGYCSLGCFAFMLDNDSCEAACNVPQCGFDSGKCAECAPGCLFQMMGNGACEEACFNRECLFDMGDCGKCNDFCAFESLGNGVCDLSCASDLCGSDYCDCYGVSYEHYCSIFAIGDGICQAECYLPATHWDNGDCDCRRGCSEELYYNERCDPECNTHECRWDDSHCVRDKQGECAQGCFSSMQNNGVCDPACNNVDCLFDMGDCNCRPGCNSEAIRTCQSWCLNYACAYGLYGRPGGCEDYFWIVLAMAVQAREQNFFAEENWNVCHNDDTLCTPQSMRESWDTQACISTVASDGLTYVVCNVPSCLSSFGFCSRDGLHNFCSRGFGPGVNECYECKSGYMRAHTTCVATCPRRFRNDVTFPNVCVPKLDTSTEENPDIIFAYNSVNEGDGTFSKPYGNLHIALAAASQQYTVIYLLGSLIKLAQASFSSSNPEIVTLNSLYDPLKDSQFELLRVESSMCSQNWTEFCSEHRTRIDITFPIRLTVASVIEFRNVSFTSSVLFASFPVDYCPYLLTINGVVVDVNGTEATWLYQFARDQCTYFTDYSVFTVLAGGALRIVVSHMQDSDVTRLSILPKAFIAIQMGHVQLENVNFTAVQTQRDAESVGVIVQTGCDADMCGSLKYVGGVVTQLNNVLLYVDTLRLGPFLYAKHLSSVEIRNVEFSHNFVVQAYSNTAVLSSYALLYLENFYSFTLDNCFFRHNFVTGGLVVISSSLVLPKTSHDGENSAYMYEREHISMSNLVFSSNLGENTILSIQFAADVLNVNLSHIAFSGNAVEGQPLLSLVSKAAVTEILVNGGEQDMFDSSTGTKKRLQIARRSVTITNVSISDTQSFQSLVYVHNLANVRFENVTFAGNGDSQSDVLTSLYDSYVTDYGVMASAKPKFPQPSICNTFVWTEASVAISVQTISVRGNHCSQGMCGVKVMGSSKNVSVADFLLENNECNSVEGLGLTFPSAVSVSITRLRAVGNKNNLGSISVFKLGPWVEIEDSWFERNDGVAGTGVYLEFVSEFRAAALTFRENRSIDSIGGAIYARLGNSLPVLFSVKNCSFASNSATRGGVLAIEAVNATSLALSVLSCEFAANTAELYGAGLFVGQFISLEDGSEVCNCSFKSHSSTYGVIYLLHKGGVLKIVESGFWANSAGEVAVIFVETQPGAVTLMENVIFQGNKKGPTILKSNSRTKSTFVTRNCSFDWNEKADVVMEGGVWLDFNSQFHFSTESKLRLTSGAIGALQSTIINSAYEENSGGAVHVMSSSSFSCERCVFTNNSAGYAGGAIFVEQESWVELVRCEFRGNRAKAGGSVLYIMSTQSKVSRVDSCVMEGNDGGVYGLILGQTAVLEMSNVTAVRNRGLECPGITLVMSHVSVSESLVSSTTGLTAGFLAMFTSSSATISQSQFLNGSSTNGGYFYLFSLSNLSISDSSFSNIRTVQGGVVSAYSSSSVSLSHVSISDSHSDVSGSLLVLSESTLTIANSRFKRYAMGGIVANQLHQVEIRESEFESGKGDRGAAMYFYQCEDVTIVRSTFTGHSGSAGGVLHFEALEEREVGGARIVDCHFEGNQGDLGGVLYANNYQVEVLGGTFLRNTAKEGGAAYFNCSLSPMCNYTISDAEITSNTAAVQGGGISWRATQPFLSNVTFRSNAAIYGPDVASFLVTLEVESLQPKADKLRKTENDSTRTISGVAPGQVVDTVIVVSLRDHYGQVVATDNSSMGVLSSSDQNSSVSGDTKVVASRGYLAFSNLLVYAKPNSTVLVDLTCSTGLSSSQASLPLTFHMRDCVPGEFRSAQSCSICSSGTFSFRPDSPCQTCLTNAVCLGNYTVIPNEGYWRAGVFDSVIWECPNKEACLGGLSSGKMASVKGECKEGYKGNLCQSCADGYSSPSKNKCEKCLPPATNILRLCFIALAAIVAIVIIVWSALHSATRPAATHSILIRIFVNYLQLVLLVMDFKLRWPEAVLRLFESQGAVGGATEQAYSVDCFLVGGGTGADLFYRKSLLMALLPIPLIGGAVLFWLAVAIRYRKIVVLRRECAATIVVLFFLILPSLVKSLFTLFSCTEIQPGQYWLTVDLDIPCWDATHTTYLLGLGLPGIIVWVFGVPLLTLLVLAKRMKEHKETWLLMQFGFLISGYRHHSFYWEFVILYRKVAIISCSVFLNGSIPVQALTVQFVLLLAFFLQYNNNPYSTAYLNSIETWAILVADISIYCGLYYLTKEISAWVSWFFFVLIVTSNVLFTAFWLAGLLEHFAVALSRRIPLVRRCLGREDVMDEEIEALIQMCRKPKPIAAAFSKMSLMDCYRLGIGQTVGSQRFLSKRYRLYPVYANSSVDFTT